MQKPPRLHRSITGDDSDLREQDPADEAMMESWLASLRASQDAEFRRADAREEVAYVLHRRKVARAAQLTDPRRTGRLAPRARGAGRPRAQAARSSARSGDSGDSDSGLPEART